jgi:hypothetical protein
MNLLFTLGSGRRVHDLGSGLNIFSRSVFAEMDLRTYADDLRFNNFLLLGLVDGGKRFRFFPISWREDDQISNVRLVSQSVGMLRLLFDYVARRQAFRTQDFRREAFETYGFDVLHEIATEGRHDRPEP